MKELPSLGEGWGGAPGGMVGVCGQDYHFAIFRYEKYKKHSFCVGFHHFFYNFGILFLVPYTKDFGKITQF